MGEFELIARLVGHVGAPVQGVRLDTGDDAAWLDSGGRGIVATIDAIADGAHFVSAEHSGEAIGWKAMAVNLSDVAAMGAEPWVALVVITVPPGADALAEAIQRGMAECAGAHGTRIVGGDFVTAGSTHVTVALLGRDVEGRVVARAGARAGDGLWVSGALGGSILGRHLRPTPRVALGVALNRAGPPRAMIDVSDGLAGDVRHLCRASGVGARIFADAVPIARDAHVLARRTGKSALEHALTDGEDFELLFAADSALEAWIAREGAALGVPLTRVGELAGASDQLVLVQATGAEAPLAWRGYEHGG